MMLIHCCMMRLVIKTKIEFCTNSWICQHLWNKKNAVQLPLWCCWAISVGDLIPLVHTTDRWWTKQCGDKTNTRAVHTLVLSRQHILAQGEEVGGVGGKWWQSMTLPGCYLFCIWWWAQRRRVSEQFWALDQETNQRCLKTMLKRNGGDQRLFEQC